MSASLRVQRFTGAEFERYIPELARLRIEVFHDFPYLYDGDTDYEEKYLSTYLRAKDPVIVIAFDGDRVIGASTGMPITEETEEIGAPFIENGYPVECVFYFAESVLQKNYRGFGLGVRFFDEREAHARSLGRFDFTCFCSVQRPADHPRRPPEYVPLDRFWTKRGYTKRPELTTEIIWKDLDDATETPKPMTFWLKDWRKNASP
jgi:GNAT superfamily N-acetyltransferase